MIGFGIDKTQIDNAINRVHRFFIENRIQYSPVLHYHISIAQIIGSYNKDNLVRSVQNIKYNTPFNPKKIKILRGLRTPNDYIVIEYKANNDYVGLFRKLTNEYNTFKFNKIVPHISIFVTDKGRISDDQIQEINSDIKLKRVKPTEIQIWNSKREIEFKERKR